MLHHAASCCCMLLHVAVCWCAGTSPKQSSALCWHRQRLQRDSQHLLEASASGPSFGRRHSIVSHIPGCSSTLGLQPECLSLLVEPVLGPCLAPGLRHADNMVAISSARFSPRPLVLQGPGAGAAVTRCSISEHDWVHKGAHVLQYARRCQVF